MGKKSLKVTVNGLSDDNYVNVTYQIAKTVKSIAPDSDISILGASPETFEDSSNKKIKGK